MALPVLAREFIFEVNTGTDATPVWTRIGGLKEWSAGSDSSDADTTDFESAGVDEHLVSRRSHTMTLTGQRETGDPGQDAVQALALAIGAPSIKKFRMTAPLPAGATTGNIKTFSASARVPWAGSGGGSMDDPTGWEANLKITGSIVTT